MSLDMTYEKNTILYVLRKTNIYFKICSVSVTTKQNNEAIAKLVKEFGGILLKRDIAILELVRHFLSFYCESIHA